MTTPNIPTRPVDWRLQGPRSLRVQMNDQQIKALLTANTNRSFDSGAFGLPWFECTNLNGETEGFFGVDHLGQVADYLGLDRALARGFRAAL